MRHARLPIILCICLILIACQRATAINDDAVLVTPSSEPRLIAAPTATELPDLWERFSHPIDCALPCWDGMVPGVTTVSEGKEIIKSTVGLTYAGMGYNQYNPPQEGYSALLWEGHYYTAAANFDPKKPKTGVLTSLNIEIALTAGFTLSQVRGIYGEPSHVYFFADYLAPDDGITDSAYDKGYTYYMDIVYLNQGFIVIGEPFYSNRADDIFESLDIERIFLFPVGDKTAFRRAYASRGGSPIPWNSDWTMRDYCAAAFHDTSITDRCPPAPDD